MRKIEVVVPEGVEISITKLGDNLAKVVVKGPRGELEKLIKAKNIEITIKDGKVDVNSDDKAMINTTLSHIKNMIEGVTKGFTKKMVVRYSHFPINLEVRGNKLYIKNFLGERKERVAEIVGNTKVNIKGQELIIEGISKEDVSQTAANIRQATKIRNKDFRVFQDGIYLAGE